MRRNKDNAPKDGTQILGCFEDIVGSEMLVAKWESDCLGGMWVSGASIIPHKRLLWWDEYSQSGKLVEEEEECSE